MRKSKRIGDKETALTRAAVEMTTNDHIGPLTRSRSLVARETPENWRSRTTCVGRCRAPHLPSQSSHSRLSLGGRSDAGFPSPPRARLLSYYCFLAAADIIARYTILPVAAFVWLPSSSSSLPRRARRGHHVLTGGFSLFSAFDTTEACNNEGDIFGAGFIPVVAKY
jgi:hypothetical protein